MRLETIGTMPLTRWSGNLGVVPQSGGSGTVAVRKNPPNQFDNVLVVGHIPSTRGAVSPRL